MQTDTTCTRALGVHKFPLYCRNVLGAFQEGDKNGDRPQQPLRRSFAKTFLIEVEMILFIQDPTTLNANFCRFINLKSMKVLR